MKYVKYYIASAVLLSLGACTQEEEVEDALIEGKGALIGVLPEATSETRTTLGQDGFTTYWATGDALTVSDGTTASKYTLQTASNAQTTGIFNGAALTAGKQYYAIYPAVTLSGTTASVGIATTQSDATFKNNDIKISKAVAEVNDGQSTARFPFNQIAAKLEIDINLEGLGSNIVESDIYRVDISTADDTKMLSGTCSVDLAASNPALSLVANGKNTISYYFTRKSRMAEHASVLMIPGDLTATTLQFQIYTDAQVITVVKKPSKAYEPGMSYTLRLNAVDFIKEATTKIEYMMGGEYDMGDFVIASAPLYKTNGRYRLMNLQDSPHSEEGNFTYGVSNPYSFGSIPYTGADRAYIWGGGDNCGENLTTTTQAQGTLNEDPCVLYDKQINGWSSKPYPYRGYRLPSLDEARQIATLLQQAQNVKVKCGEAPGHYETVTGRVFGDYLTNGDGTVSLTEKSLYYPYRRMWVAVNTYANWIYGTYWTSQNSGRSAYFYDYTGAVTNRDPNYTFIGVRCVKGYNTNKIEESTVATCDSTIHPNSATGTFVTTAKFVRGKQYEIVYTTDSYGALLLKFTANEAATVLTPDLSKLNSSGEGLSLSASVTYDGNSKQYIITAKLISPVLWDTTGLEDVAQTCVENVALCTNDTYLELMKAKCAKTCGDQTKHATCVEDRNKNCAQNSHLCKNELYEEMMKKECAVTCGYKKPIVVTIIKK